jgi:hypothetical protein
MVTVVLVIVGFTLAGVLISAFYFLDRLIRHECQFHRDVWEKDGRSTGHLFRPPEATWFRSGFAFQRCALGLALHTPRWCVLTWNAGFILFFVFVVRYRFK